MDTQKIIQLWNGVRSGLIATIDKLSDDDLRYIPFKNGYSVGQIILHIAHEEYGEIQYGLTRELSDFPQPFSEAVYSTVDLMKSLLEDVHNKTIHFLLTLDDEQLEGDFEAQWGEKKPLIDFIFHVIEHELHHRGELSLILGLLGLEGLDA
jgi:uncharacterized damage-inducible protein DinB